MLDAVGVQADWKPPVKEILANNVVYMDVYRRFLALAEPSSAEEQLIHSL